VLNYLSIGTTLSLGHVIKSVKLRDTL
jgi:hypothetical protein